MKASKLSNALKAYVVKRGEEAVPVAGLCREVGISQVTTSTRRRSAPDPFPPLSLAKQTQYHLIDKAAMILTKITVLLRVVR